MIVIRVFGNSSRAETGSVSTSVARTADRWKCGGRCRMLASASCTRAGQVVKAFFQTTGFGSSIPGRFITSYLEQFSSFVFSSFNSVE